MQSIEKIEEAFCEYYRCCCKHCPIHRYRINDGLAYCYYAVEESSTEQQKRLFLDAARKEWRRELNESAYISRNELKLLFGRVTIV